MVKIIEKLFSIMKILLVIIIIAVFAVTVYTADVKNILRNNVNGILSVSDVPLDEVQRTRNINGNSSLLWTYKCGDTCEKVPKREDEEIITLETCNMLCQFPQLWPKPVNISIRDKTSSTFSKSQLKIYTNVSNTILNDISFLYDNFIKNLPTLEEQSIHNEDILEFKLHITVTGNETRLKISTDESYILNVKKYQGIIEARLTAPTYFGARHGVETLSQLIWYDYSIQKLRIIHDVFIQDKPVFPHRGVMVDTARNYFPVNHLKKVLEGMAASKLNVFHLHLTDGASFPIVLPNNKMFSVYGAYSPEMVYTPEDIKGLIEYARVRGIRVILEIDAPSHVNHYLNYARENIVMCGEENIFNGHLNPDNKDSLEVLKSIYQDLLELGTDDETFHIGGDEVNLTCWKNTQAARKYSKNMSLVWADYANQILDTVKSANNKLPENILLWSSHLTDRYIGYLKYNKNVAVQYWYGQIDPILENGFKILFSTVGHWYLDCGFGPWRRGATYGVCDPYTPWQKFYLYRPWNDYKRYINQVLGGEVCLWSEQVDVDSLETRIWPRAAAFAERVWSDFQVHNEVEVFTRLDTHRRLLIQRGLKAAAIWPQWCSQNPGKC